MHAEGAEQKRIPRYARDDKPRSGNWQSGGDGGIGFGGFFAYAFEWEEDGEDGATSDATADFNESTMLGDDFFGDPKAETRAAQAFGGVEGFEDASQNFGRDAAAIVTDGDANSGLARLPVATTRGAENKSTVLAEHGVERIANEIGELPGAVHLRSIEAEQ